MDAVSARARWVLLAAAWASSVGLAFLWGSSRSGRAPDLATDGDVGARPAASASDPDPRAPEAPALRGSAEDPSPALPPPTGGVVPPALGVAPAGPDPRLDAVRSLVGRSRTLLARGREGTADLVRWLGSETQDSEAHAWFWSERDSWAGAKRVWEEFVATNREAWVEFLVASLEEISRRPEAFEESAGCSGFLGNEYATLPAFLAPERLDALSRTMREAAGRWPGEDPRRAHGARGLLAGTLASWAASLSGARAADLLRRGGLGRPETLALLARLQEEGVAGKDLAGALGELSESSEAFWEGVGLSPWPVPADAVPALDPVVLDVAGRYGGTTPSHVAGWLQRTERGGWPAARPFLETGIERGGRAAEVCALALPRLGPRPDSDYVRWLLSRVALPAPVVTELRAAFEVR